MNIVRHHEVMFGLILIAAIVVLGVLVYAGVDSRVDEVARRRRYNG